MDPKQNQEKAADSAQRQSANPEIAKEANHHGQGDKAGSGNATTATEAEEH